VPASSHHNLRAAVQHEKERSKQRKLGVQKNLILSGDIQENINLLLLFKEFIMIEIFDRCISSDGSIKYGFVNSAGNRFEAITFIYNGHHERKPITVRAICISSQAGCNLACSFCATGLEGFYANLTGEEMLQQIELVQRDLESSGLPPATGYAVMGMGEPLLNLPVVIEFFRAVRKNQSRYIEPLSLSTVGVAPRIRQLAEVSDVNYRLFVSLHSPYNEERVNFIPLTSKYPIEEVLSACREYSQKKGSRVEASYLLFKGVNDSERHARDLAKLLDPHHFDAQILLYNEIEGLQYERPSMESAEMFKDILSATGIMTTVQVSKGIDIQGGCGQLTRKRPG
jgi:23S rRNA (adenine2503-C2)-methyltransferase